MAQDKFRQAYAIIEALHGNYLESAQQYIQEGDMEEIKVMNSKAVAMGEALNCMDNATRIHDMEELEDLNDDIPELRAISQEHRDD